MESQSNLEKEISNTASDLREELINMRRDFYMHPELSGEEKRTASVISNKLEELGLEVEKGVGGHGVVGLLEGNRDKPIVGWRADIDALPIQDTLEKPYKSTVKGIKHACGHDAHTTIGLGIAMVLSSVRENIPGTVKFIFQPSEETASGAHAVIKSGALKTITPDAIFGLHVSSFPVGQVVLIDKQLFPALQYFYISLRWRDEEGENNDLKSIVDECISELVSLSTVPGIRKPPANLKEAYVIFDSILVGESDLGDFLNVGCQISKQHSNSEYLISGGIQAADDQLHEKLKGHIKQKLEVISKKYSFEYKLEFGVYTPAVRNDSSLVEELYPSLQRTIGVNARLGKSSVFPFSSDDFGVYLKEIPGIMFILGVSSIQKKISGVVHTPDFNIDEACIETGVKTMANVLVSYLSKRDD